MTWDKAAGACRGVARGARWTCSWVHLCCHCHGGRRTVAAATAAMGGGPGAGRAAASSALQIDNNSNRGVTAAAARHARGKSTTAWQRASRSPPATPSPAPRTCMSAGVALPAFVLAATAWSAKQRGQCGSVLKATANRHTLGCGTAPPTLNSGAQRTAVRWRFLGEGATAASAASASLPPWPPPPPAGAAGQGSLIQLRWS